MDKLKEPGVVETLQEEVTDKLRATVTRGTSIDQNWSILKNAIVETTSEVIGELKMKRNDWFDQECAQALQEKNGARLKMLNDCSTHSGQGNYENKRRVEL